MFWSSARESKVISRDSSPHLLSGHLKKAAEDRESLLWKCPGIWSGFSTNDVCSLVRIWGQCVSSKVDETPGVPHHGHCWIAPAPLGTLLITCPRVRFFLKIYSKILDSFSDNYSEYANTSFMDQIICTLFPLPPILISWVFKNIGKTTLNRCSQKQREIVIPLKNSPAHFSNF